MATEAACKAGGLSELSDSCILFALARWIVDGWEGQLGMLVHFSANIPLISKWSTDGEGTVVTKWAIIFLREMMCSSSMKLLVGPFAKQRSVCTKIVTL